jgi:hypothetical protein
MGAATNEVLGEQPLHLVFERPDLEHPAVQLEPSLSRQRLQSPLGRYCH